MQLSSNNTQFLVNQLVWIGIPLSLVAIIGTFVLLNFYVRRMLAGMGCLSSRITGRTFSPLSSARGSLKYYLMSSRTSHKQIACSRCSSKMKRLGLSTHLNAGKKRDQSSYGKRTHVGFVKPSIRS
jgi:hypothetical protein